MYKFGCYTPADRNNSPGTQARVSFQKYMPPSHSQKSWVILLMNIHKPNRVIYDVSK